MAAVARRGRSSDAAGPRPYHRPRCPAPRSPSTGRAACAARRRCATSSPRRPSRTSDLVAPLFVREGIAEPQPIVSLPGVVQHTRESLRKEVAELAALGVRAVVLFGVPARKDAVGSGAFDPDGIVQLALADLRGDVGDDVVLIADLCVDEYTDHGHCGVLDERGDVDNDATLEIYAKAAVAQARAGAHVVAPSGMMDGQVGRIRAALDGDGFDRRVDPRLLGEVRAAGCTGRSATRSTCTIVGGGDRKGYQQDWRNAREALREIDADIAQGADMVMVKPALAYLDVIQAARERGRRAGRGVPRQRGVRHDQGGRGQRLDRRRRRRPRAPHGDQAGRRRRHPHLPRPLVRRGPGRGPSDDGRSSPYCDPARARPPGATRSCASGAACRPTTRCSSARRAAIPGGVNSSIRAFKAVGGAPVRRRPGRGPVRLGRRGHALHRPRPELRRGDPRPRPPGGHAARSPRPRRTARRSARRRRGR